MDAAALLLAALLCAEVAAVVLAVRARVARPLVLLLSFALVDELAVLGLHAILEGAPHPIAGIWRVPYHVENALSLGWPCLLAAVAWGRPWRRLRVLAGAYAVALGGMIAAYPIDAPGSGAPRTRVALLAWELACVALAWWGIARRWRATWGPVERCLVVLVACESAVVLVGPFASDPFTRWWIARAFYLGAWGLVSAVLWRGTMTRSS